MSERDLAEAIHREIISPESVEHAVALWNERAQIMARQQRMLSVLARTSANALARVLARRQSEAARDPSRWEGAATEDEWRSRLATQCGQTLAARAQCERMQEALERIANWSEAYPLASFLEPDLKKARELLEAGGITLDAVSAHCMRHVIDGVGKIAREAARTGPWDAP